MNADVHDKETDSEPVGGNDFAAHDKQLIDFLDIGVSKKAGISRDTIIKLSLRRQIWKDDKISLMEMMRKVLLEISWRWTVKSQVQKLFAWKLLGEQAAY